MPQLEFAVEDEQAGPVLVVRGEIDLATADELRARIGDYAALVGAAPAVLDVAAVTFIDSTGLKALLSAQAELPDGQRLALRGVPSLFQRVLEITGMLDAFDRL
jgi:anti-anti-sigma factor